MEHLEFFGPIAGKVWKALNAGGPKTLTQLQKSTGLSLKEVSMGLGWLAREDKLCLNGDDGFRAAFELRE
jgi:hypothetical protein